MATTSSSHPSSAGAIPAYARAVCGRNRPPPSPSPPTPAGAPPAYARAVGGVDGSRAATAAAEQSARLAAPAGAVELVAVTWTTGFGPTRVADLAPARAERCLE